jgi:hypothetical protein
VLLGAPSARSWAQVTRPHCRATTRDTHSSRQKFVI